MRVTIEKINPIAIKKLINMLYLTIKLDIFKLSNPNKYVIELITKITITIKLRPFKLFFKSALLSDICVDIEYIKNINIKYFNEYTLGVNNIILIKLEISSKIMCIKPFIFKLLIILTYNFKS
ncbi:hypothetical protein, partial [Clostridioides difficile]|uniref:hypothetical protein n=1 Tax=Clostridioides difficile TaxID=1496 RepID=UPI0015965716